MQSDGFTAFVSTMLHPVGIPTRLSKLRQLQQQHPEAEFFACPPRFGRWLLGKRRNVVEASDKIERGTKFFIYDLDASVKAPVWTHEAEKEREDMVRWIDDDSRAIISVGDLTHRIGDLDANPTTYL